MAGAFRPSRALEELVNSALNGQLDEARFRQLEALLREDRNALRWYRDLVSLQVDLRTVMTAKRVNRQALAQIESLAQDCSELAGESLAPSPIKPAARLRKRGFFRRMIRPLRRYRGDQRFALAMVWISTILFASAVAGVVAGLMTLFRDGSRPNEPSVAEQAPPSSQPVPASPVARLSRAVDCVWSGETTSPAIGDNLAAGRKLVLKTGLAEIVFLNGAQAIVEGPAVFEVCAGTAGRLTRGKCTVTVEDPLARGFEIRTQDMKYTDLGTEFGTLVAPSGEQEMHVFRGRVQAEQGPVSKRQGADGTKSPLSVSSSPLIVSAHQAIRVAAPDLSGQPSNPIELIAADEKQFVRREQLAMIAARPPEFRRWKQYSDDLRKRQDLAAYYDFQPDESDRAVLRNRAATGMQFDGRLAGEAAWTEGRFPGKSALRIERPKSGVRISIPDEFQQLTLVAWVCVDSQTRATHDLLSSNGWNRRPGELQWRVMGQGEVSSATHPAQSTKEKLGVDSPPVIFGTTPQWHFVSATYDCAAGKVVLYCDGRAVAERTAPQLLSPITIGEAMIGDWDHQGIVPRDDRPLLGRMDELMLFRTVLPPDEIQQMYEAAKVSTK
jgi:hypothetical protein